MESDKRPAPKARVRITAFLDGIRWFLGGILVLDAFRSILVPDASLLGILVRLPGGTPLPAAAGLLLGTALIVRWKVSAIILGAFALLAVVNIIEFYRLRAAGLHAAPLPFSLVTLAILLGALAQICFEVPKASWLWRAAGLILTGPVLILAHLVSFGTTDYSRPAEAIVVFGAKAYRNGTPSLALADRVNHGIMLWHQGLAPVLVMSGGADEVPVMKRLAVEAGVPEAAIECDPEGLDTYATIANLRHKRVLAVSHYYHLARIKLVARRFGVRCATVPCTMSRRLRREPYYVGRECAAFAAYYLLHG
jgi:uncharacterized SAM-binding protein YcdF (DUF218 family)